MVRSLALRLAILLALGLAVQAGPISENIWYQFSFTDPGVSPAGCFPADPAGGFCIPSSGTPTTFADAPAWTITLAVPNVLFVVDAFEAGDTFEILDFGVVIGMTSGFTPGTDCGDDPTACLFNPGMSRGAFMLAAGDHSITIVPLTAPSGGGSGYFTVAPEPGAFILAAAGLAVLALRRSADRRRS